MNGGSAFLAHWVTAGRLTARRRSSGYPSRGPVLGKLPSVHNPLRSVAGRTLRGGFMSEVNDEVWIGDWVALLPLTLSTAEKHCLETIERLASPLGASFSQLSEDTEEIDLVDSLDRLEKGRKFISVLPPSFVGEETRYAITDTGKLWLKRCEAATNDSLLADDLVGLFHSFDEPLKRRFTAFAA